MTVSQSSKKINEWIGDLAAVVCGISTFIFITTVGITPKPIELETAKGKPIRVMLVKQKAVISTEKQEVPIQTEEAKMEREITKVKTWTAVEQPKDVKNGVIEDEVRPAPPEDTFVAAIDQAGVFAALEEREGRYEGDPFDAGDISLVNAKNDELVARLPELGISATPGGDTLVLVYLMDSTGVVHDARQLVPSKNALEDLTLTTVFYDFIGKQITTDAASLNLGAGQYKWMVYELKHEQERKNEFIP